MKQLIPILLYIWQLPQNIVGLIVRVFFKEKTRKIYKGKTIRVCPKFKGGISLGNTIIVNKYPTTKDTWNDVKHEWGHARQSLYWGPLYLIVFGIPSGLWYWIQDNIIKKDYYSFYTERSADRYGKVER